MSEPLPRFARSVLRAAAEALLPATAQLDGTGWEQLLATIAAALAQRPPRVRRQFLVFLRVLDLLPLRTHRRRFRRLPVDQRAAVLHGLEHAPRMLLRRGVWGVRTLVFMGFYTQPAQAAAIGYRATADGWRAPRPAPDADGG